MALWPFVTVTHCHLLTRGIGKLESGSVNTVRGLAEILDFLVTEEAVTLSSACAVHCEKFPSRFVTILKKGERGQITGFNLHLWFWVVLSNINPLWKHFPWTFIPPIKCPAEMICIRKWNTLYTFFPIWDVVPLPCKMLLGRPTVKVSGCLPASTYSEPLKTLHTADPEFLRGPTTS